MSAPIPIDLPDRPLSIRDTHALVQYDGIDHAAPLLGMNPTPTATVVGLYLGVADTVVLVGYGTDDETWTGCATVQTSAIGTSEYTAALDTLINWLERANPGRTFGLLQDKRQSRA